MENSKPIIIPKIKDREGLDIAYSGESKLDVNVDTMYVAGRSSVQDWYYDLKNPT